ncbi:conserved hypothetical protein [Ectothiorhodosinus mongolicus]|uniref:Purine nucleoside phosphorylase n=1 Tax=Ectothiorhodosinus mongolicus TaxID=233100 RepID=A0A1R3W233_9GAMM|nr:peptidoglycan editing factor PgeF [Ectothiorhodosinus mongolicus]ULX57236.1 hypothetical protein CKX93_05730 [Ectothiorhodosinus mongolicus]SIT70556.1 conserved hypothetical protein [Ectothiorhodosinus mongolicus]
MAARIPDWSLPNGVKAAFTDRLNGVSQGSYASFNLSLDVGDDPEAVEHNRGLLQQALALPGQPCWLKQVHGCAVVNVGVAEFPQRPEADASLSRDSGGVCAVLTADCLPVLLSDLSGSVIAAAHAGWRGLADGVIEATIESMNCRPQELTVWLGPCIGPKAFCVGEDVRQAFLKQDPSSDQGFVKTDTQDQWLGDLQWLAKRRLEKQGVKQIAIERACTFSEPDTYYSFRRDNGVTGRMASLIWFAV